MLTEESIKEFQKIYKDKFKREIDEKQALEMCMKILSFFKAIIDGLNVKDKDYIKSRS
jgi:hypothetical protein